MPIDYSKWDKLEVSDDETDRSPDHEVRAYLNPNSLKDLCKDILKRIPKKDIWVIFGVQVGFKVLQFRVLRG